MTGFITTVGCGVLFLVVVLMVIYFSNRKKEEDFGTNVYFSSEAVRVGDKLETEFRRLVFRIAVYKAKEAGKMHILKKGESVPKEKLILPQDIETAFAQATKEIRLSDPGCGACDNKTLADRIRDLQKQYENKTP
jgi:hypothetical protein